MPQLTADVGIEVVRRFLNSLDVDAGTDELADVERFGSWLDADQDLPSVAPISASDLAAARRLRQALRDLASSNHDGVTAPDAVATLNDAAREHAPELRFVVDGAVGAHLAGTGGGVGAVLGDLVAAVVVAIGDGSWQRLKLCGVDTCQWAFLDSSRNRSGRWCSMAGCGNRTKARNFRRRQAEATPSRLEGREG